MESKILIIKINISKLLASYYKQFSTNLKIKNKIKNLQKAAYNTVRKNKNIKTFVNWE